MNIQKHVFVLWAGCSLVLLNPFFVYADRCDDMMGRARKVFDSGARATEQGKNAEAIRFFQEAEKYYESASQMKNCQCPKIASVSRYNIQMCKNNIESNKRALAGKQQHADDLATYNEAMGNYRQADSCANKQQWDNAVYFFEKAAAIWEGMSSQATENGRRAIESARMARNKAALARKQMGRQ
ncbi:MAG: hypothetical protein WC450_02350 [Candidatus Omnitrophota bacterium]|jgi:tetratricopeptide (TPR) repeat protein